MKLPCPKCGSKDTNGTFCNTCLSQLHPLVKKIKQGKLICCVSCRDIKLTGTWHSFDETYPRALAPTLTFDGKITSVEFETPNLEWKPGIKKITEVLTVVTGKHEEAITSYEEEYEVPVFYEITSCPKCKKKGTTYYEGVLQVRNETKIVKKKVQTYVKEHRVHITKQSSLPNGTDYYITDHRAVGHLARKLHKNFGGQLKINAKHFSQSKEGKVLYRTNALLSLPEFKKGDVILRNDEYFLILGISSKIKARNLLTGSQEVFLYLPGEAHVLPQAKTQVTNTNPLEVLHPTTFQPVTPENSAAVVLDQEVTVATDGDKVIML